MEKKQKFKALTVLVALTLISVLPFADASITIRTGANLNLPKYGTNIMLLSDSLFDSVYRESDSNTSYASFWFLTNESFTYGLCPQTVSIALTSFSNETLAYSKTGAGVEQFYLPSQPTGIMIDNAATSQGWNYSSNILTVFGAVSNVVFTFTANTDPDTGGSGGAPLPTNTPTGDGGAISPTSYPPFEVNIDTQQVAVGIIILCAGAIVAVFLSNSNGRKRNNSGPIFNGQTAGKNKPVFK